MSNIEKNLNALKWIIYILAVLIAASPIFLFWAPETSVLFFQNELLEQYGGVSILLPWQKILGFFVASLPAGFLLWALVSLSRLLTLLRGGQWFAESSEIQCRRFAHALLWYVDMQIIHRTLLVLILTATYPVGKKEIYLALSSDDLMTLVPAIFALIFAHIVHLARQQRDELLQIV